MIDRNKAISEPIEGNKSLRQEFEDLKAVETKESDAFGHGMHEMNKSAFEEILKRMQFTNSDIIKYMLQRSTIYLAGKQLKIII